MEGTPHERISIVITSYVIGFITAFIFFGFTNKQVSDYTVYSYNFSNDQTKLNTNLATNNGYKYSSGKLEVRSGNKVTLLSSNPEIATTLSKQGNPALTAHYSEPTVNMSPDNKYLFFCVQEFQNANYCISNLYNFEDNVVYPVMYEDDPFTISNELSTLVDWNESGLHLDTLHSVSAVEPWILTDTKI